MPRKAKDEENLIEEKKTKKPAKKSTTKKNTKVAAKSATSKTKSTKSAVKSTTTKSKNSKSSSKTAVKKSSTKSIENKSNKKKVTTKKEANDKKATTKKKVSVAKTKKETPKTTKKASKPAVKKAATKKAVKTSAKSKKIEIVEYYDLPYRYNKTIVKVLAQTPNILFVYWDISDEDKQNYINQYGEFFFNDTKPVLIIHNETMNYSFEVDINDFANSWYLHIKDANCDYKIELGRRPINKYAKIDNYLYISSSNEMDAPNDHILFDKLNNIVYFRNIKSNLITEKDISLSFLTKIGKIYDVKNFYKQMYKDENIDFEKLNLKNMPSS